MLNEKDQNPGELTQEMINDRLAAVASGSWAPVITDLPGIVFTKMDLRAKGKSSREYSAKLKELFQDGSYFSESLIPALIKTQCDQAGFSARETIVAFQAIQKRYYDTVPKELMKPIDELTEEEHAKLSPEDQEARIEKIQARGQAIRDFNATFYTDDDFEVQAKMRQIENLENSLKVNSAEHIARAYRASTEIILCAKKFDTKGEQLIPYFKSTEEIEELEIDNPETWTALMSSWNQFKNGLHPQFFRPDSAQVPGVDSDNEGGRG